MHSALFHMQHRTNPHIFAIVLTGLITFAMFKQLQAHGVNILEQFGG
jgi:ABC-type polysaccharide/polyol phosphate export permease